MRLGHSCTCLGSVGEGKVFSFFSELYTKAETLSNRTESLLGALIEAVHMAAKETEPVCFSGVLQVLCGQQAALVFSKPPPKKDRTRTIEECAFMGNLKMIHAGGEAGEAGQEGPRQSLGTRDSGIWHLHGERVPP